MAFSDRIICEIDTALRTLLPPKKRQCYRESPATCQPDYSLSQEQAKHIAGLMRVNHSGEVCAQALYQGQGMTAKLPDIREKMLEAAAEEIDHLGWCEQRLYELNSQPSVLNGLWYFGSLIMGAAAGLAGDKYSLGFVAETENQVTEHLKKHIQQLPAKDKKTHAILNQMKEDETLHAETAIQSGATELPFVLKKLMQMTSKLMTKSSYYL